MHIHINHSDSMMQNGLTLKQSRSIDGEKRAQNLYISNSSVSEFKLTDNVHTLFSSNDISTMRWILIKTGTVGLQ
jgi:hypothetical protein